MTADDNAGGWGAVSVATEEKLKFLDKELEAVTELTGDAVKQTVPRLNEAAGRMLTLTTALAGGSLAFLKDDVCTGWGRVSAVVLFMAALAVAAFAVIPVGWLGKYNFREIVDDMEAVRKRKACLLYLAFWLMVAGLGVAALGNAVRTFSPAAPAATPRVVVELDRK